MAAPVFVGTAGWTVPREARDRFPSEGSHLERYAARLNAVEINSSFYRPHRPATYRRWAASVPDHFRFSVKLPREITHKRRFVDVAADVDRFLAEATSLGDKLGPILIQLPPSFAFDESLTGHFLELMRARFEGLLALEPRHATWFTGQAEEVLLRFDVARVAADPVLVGAADQPAGWRGLSYYRLHGSPRTYYSPYSDEYLAGLAERLAIAPGLVWCIFDNTALGYAAGDALRTIALLSERRT